MSKQIKDLIRLVRPYQWIKNGFVFTGFLFIKGWRDPTLTLRVVLAASAFALVAGSVYVLNDLWDRERDRQHEQKRLRPLAAGTVSPRAAIYLLVLLMAAGLALGSSISNITVVLLCIYIVFNVF